jgi:hypothetical protein
MEILAKRLKERAEQLGISDAEAGSAAESMSGATLTMPPAGGSLTFSVQPRLAGHGPTLFAGFSKYVELKLVDQRELTSGAMALRYEPRR